MKTGLDFWQKIVRKMEKGKHNENQGLPPTLAIAKASGKVENRKPKSLTLK